MFWSQKSIWLAYPALAQNHARGPANPALPTLNKYFPRKVLPVSICCLSFDVRVGS